MSELNKQIGYRISSLRKDKHMTQEQLAETLDISIKHCSCVERGVSALSLEKMVDLCEILDTNMDYLVRGETYTSLNNMPPSFVEYLKRAKEDELKVMKEYLSLYAKIREVGQSE